MNYNQLVAGAFHPLGRRSKLVGYAYWTAATESLRVT